MQGDAGQRCLFFCPYFPLRSLCLKWGQLQYSFFYAIYSVNAVLFSLVLGIPVNFFLEWNLKPLSVFFQRLFNQEGNQWGLRPRKYLGRQSSSYSVPGNPYQSLNSEIFSKSTLIDQCRKSGRSLQKIFAPFIRQPEFPDPSRSEREPTKWIYFRQPLLSPR